MDYFVKLLESDTTTNMVKNHPNEFLLLTMIALRAWKGHGINLAGLQAGQARIGVGDVTGIMTNQAYRTAKKNLCKWGVCLFQPTSKGTVATLIDATVYDISCRLPNKPATTTPTGEQQADQQSSNKQTTTKQERREEESKESLCEKVPDHANGYSPGFIRFWSQQIHKKRKDQTWHEWVRQGCEAIADEINESYTAHMLSDEWQREKGQFAVRPLDFIANRLWKDTPGAAAADDKPDRPESWKGYAFEDEG